MSVPFYTVYYLAGLGPSRKSLLLPSKTPLDTRTYALDAGQFCKFHNLTISTIAILRDPTLAVGNVVKTATTIQFTVAGGSPTALLPTIGFELFMSNGDNENLVVTQPIEILTPIMPAGAVLVGGQVVTAHLQPVDILSMMPLPGGTVGSDTVLVVRPGIGGADPLVGSATVASLLSGGRQAGDIFTFHQASPTSVWVIAHNLGRHPTATVVDTSGSEVEGSTAYIDSNNLTVTFSAGFAGTAYIN